MGIALLVIDLQKHYIYADEESTKLALIAAKKINSAIDFFREKGLPVICIQHMDKEAGVVPGTEGFDFIEQIKIKPDDIHIVKTYFNSFTKTNLEETLRKLDVDTIIITGYCAEECVLSTYRGALDVDLTPIILRNAITSGKAENIQFVESINELISLGALRKMLNK